MRGNHVAGEYRAWHPFTEAMGQVDLIARFDAHPPNRDDGPIVDGPGVRIHRMAHYRGLFGLLAKTPTLLWSLRRLGQPGDLFIGRLPEPLAILSFVRCWRVGGRFVALVVAEPRSLVLSGIGLRGPLAWSLSRLAGWLVRSIVSRSAAVIYVSQSWLQELYPPPQGVPVLARSNVRLADEDFGLERAPRVTGNDASGIRMVSIGSMTSEVKGHDLLIDAVRELRQRGVAAELTLVGGGARLESLRNRAEALGVPVSFRGQVHERHIIREILDDADVYVSGSRSEGLSRAMVEAMARGLPIVSTNAGAVGELLDPECIVPVDDAPMLADRLASLMSDAEQYSRTSARNLARARQVAALAAPERLVEFLRSLDAPR